MGRHSAHVGPGDSNGVFRGRAIALIGTLAPVLVWMRDHKGQNERNAQKFTVVPFSPSAPSKIAI